MEEGDSTRQINPESTAFYFADGDSSFDDGRYPPPIGPGTVIDNKYRVLSFIGEGGCGSVYLVEHVELGEKAALKLLSEKNNEKLSTRFAQEAKFACRLNHPGIIRIFNYGTHDGHPYYAMEVVQGLSLKAKLSQEGAIPLAEALKIALAVCDSLNYAHAKGIVHRDIKPANIVLTASKNSRDFPVKLLDFGIARAVDPDGSAQSLTVTGEIIGSPLYMSPEQSHGRSVDERSDIYSLGCTIFEMIAGEPPYRGKSVLGTIMLHNEGEIPSLSSRTLVKVPQVLDEALTVCMAKKVEDRYQSAAELYDMLCAALEEVVPAAAGKRRSLLAQEPARPTKKLSLRGWLLVGGSALVAMVLLGMGLYQANRKSTELPVLKNADATSIGGIGTVKEDQASLTKEAASAPQVRIGEYLLDGGKHSPGQRHYVFPESPKLGDFAICFPNGEARDLTLLNGRELYVPEHSYLRLKAYPSLCEESVYFRGFPPDAVQELHLVKNLALSNVNDILKNIAHFQYLNVLDLEWTDADDASLALLSAQKHLQMLDLRNTEVTAAGLAKSPLSRQLTQLLVSDLKSNLGELFTTFKGSHLWTLVLDRCLVTKDDLKQLCQITTLKALCLRNCDMDREKLAALASAPALISIEIRQRKLAPDCIEALGGFKNAKILDVGLTGIDSWSEADRQRLLKSVHAVNFQN